MRSLEVLDLNVPEDIRIAGFDDVKYAHLARVPLTTMKQPCRELGELALNTLIERIETPTLPPRQYPHRSPALRARILEASRQVIVSRMNLSIDLDII